MEWVWNFWHDNDISELFWGSLKPSDEVCALKGIIKNETATEEAYVKSMNVTTRCPHEAGTCEVQKAQAFLDADLPDTFTYTWTHMLLRQFLSHQANATGNWTTIFGKSTPRLEEAQPEPEANCRYDD